MKTGYLSEKLQLYNPQESCHYHWFRKFHQMPIQPEVCYRVAGALTTVTQSRGCQTQPIGLPNMAPDTADRPQAATTAPPKDVSH